MTERDLKSLLKQASEVAAGPVPGVEQVLHRPRPKRAHGLPALIGAAASGLVAITIAVVWLTGTPAPAEPDVSVPEYLAEGLERSDLLTLATAFSDTASARSDWLLPVSAGIEQTFSSDALLANAGGDVERYVLVGPDGRVLTDPENPNLVYIVERTTP